MSVLLCSLKWIGWSSTYFVVLHNLNHEQMSDANALKKYNFRERERKKKKGNFNISRNYVVFQWAWAYKCYVLLFCKPSALTLQPRFSAIVLSFIHSHSCISTNHQCVGLKHVLWTWKKRLCSLLCSPFTHYDNKYM